VLPGAGHLVPEERAGAIVEAVTPFPGPEPAHP
jgi:hypothetical protein